MSALAKEVSKFRLWADSQSGHFGEWECDYPYWEKLYKAVGRFVESAANRTLTADELELLLYALARDNENEHILEELARFQNVAIQISKAALNYPDVDARWQAVVLLVNIGTCEALELLKSFLVDDAEYVRRRAHFTSQEKRSQQ